MSLFNRPYTYRWHLLEIFIFLGCMPMLVVLLQGHSVRHVILLAGCLYAVIRLYGKISFRRLFSLPPTGFWRGPLLRGMIVFCAAAAFMYYTDPARLFSLPLNRPLLWIVLVFLYPLISVLAQELVYRVYLFEVHSPLWTSSWQPVLVSALCFGWVHIIYTGYFALISTTLAGFMLARTYVLGREDKGTLWAVLLEHSLYGLSMFTVGLGKYFYMAR